MLCIFLSGCTSKQNSNNIPSKKANSSDSISIWIANSSNEKYSLKKRLNFLEKAYTKNKEKPKDTSAVKTLSQISLQYSILNDSLEFRKTNKETMELSKITKDSITLANSYWDLAYFFENIQVKDSAFFYYHNASKIYVNQKKYLLAGKMLKNMAWIQQGINDNTGAEINCIKAIELIKPLKNYVTLSRCYNTMGVIANNLEEYDKSIFYYKEAQKYDAKINRKQLANHNLNNNIGVLHNRSKQYSKAIPYFKQLIELDSFELKNPSLYATALNNLAYANYKLNQLEGVEVFYKKALKIRESLNETAKISGSYYNLAEYYLSQKQTKKANELALLSKKYAKLSANNDRLLEALKLLANTNPNKAADYRLEHINLMDSLQIEERKIRNKFARIRFETDEFIAENALLEKEKQLWTAAALGLVLLVIASYIIYTQRSKNQKLKFTQEQQAKNQEVFNLMLAQKQKVEEAKREEQKRISEELHDGVLGKMLGARMVLTGLNKKNDLEAVSEKDKAIVVLKNVEGEVRAISHELNHAAYQKIPNFINSITELLETQSKNAHINQDFVYDKSINWDTLSGDVKINVYRIIQECIVNSIKHAKCSSIYLNFEVYDSIFEFTVGDDGKGYKYTNDKKGIGLRNIKSRIKKLQGNFTVQSSPGHGTSFFFNIPVVNLSKYEANKIPVS